MNWWRRFLDRFTRQKSRPVTDLTRLKLRDGTEVRITGYAGPNLIGISDSGHPRLIFSHNVIVPEEFWALWRHLSGKTITWADGTVYEGTEIGPSELPPV